MGSDTDETSNWNVDLEISLFHAMRKHKPVGVARFFQMIFIHNKVNSSATVNKISSDQIWKHLSGMYDLQALNESETLPHLTKENDFSLPAGDFTELQEKDYPRSKDALSSQTNKRGQKEAEPKTPKEDPLPEKAPVVSHGGKVSTHGGKTPVSAQGGKTPTSVHGGKTPTSAQGVKASKSSTIVAKLPTHGGRDRKRTRQSHQSSSGNKAPKRQRRI